MAIRTIRVPDETEQKYNKHSGPDGRTAMEKQLVRFQDIPLDERVVVLSPEIRRRLEKLYGKPIEQQELFALFCEKLAALEVGNIHIPLSEGQLKRAQAISAKQGRGLVSYLENTIKAVVQDALGGV